MPINWQINECGVDIQGIFSNKRNEVLIHATTQMNLENTILNERCLLQRITYYMTQFI
jgi:hypothetical protein